MIGGASPAPPVIRMDYLRQAQSRSARGGRARRRRCRHAAAAGDRGRGLGQDRHAGASRRASGHERRRSAPHPAADLLAPRRRRDGAPRRAHPQPREWDAMPRAGLIWAGTFHAIGARLLREYRRAHRARPRVHDPRPRGRGRPDEPGAPRARLLAHREPLSDQGHVPCDLFARRERRGAARSRCSARRFPGARTGRPS